MALLLGRTYGQTLRFHLPNGYAFLKLKEVIGNRIYCETQVGNHVEGVVFTLGIQRMVFPNVAIAVGKTERGSVRFAIEAPKSIQILRAELICADQREAEALKAKWLDPA